MFDVGDVFTVVFTLLSWDDGIPFYRGMVFRYLPWYYVIHNLAPDVFQFFCLKLLPRGDTCVMLPWDVDMYNAIDVFHVKSWYGTI